MDIIQPTVQKASAPSSRPSRTAPTMQPTQHAAPEPVQPIPTPAVEPPQPAKHDDVSDDVLAALNMLDEPKPATTASAAEPKKEAENWPDPLDFHDFEGKDDAKTAEVPQVAIPALEPKEPAPTMAAEPTAASAEETPSTPFVMTKVEKRPLGAFASHSPEPTPSTPAEVPTEGAPVPTAETSKQDMAQASLESTQHVGHDEPEHDMGDLRQMAIPQQYHTDQPKTHDEVHSLYDTKEYHAAPQAIHTVHRSGPWLTVSVVVLIVLIIAAVAIGYFMMTGTFDLSKII
jgi:hypothetical protein